ncbi:ABC transporter substrate-binding protein [Actinopolymorpha singaporensis]|uniref:Peptide/nickel transport system substrate-binding protein n=1 Tax=Actinopolymorpha singaporensis TaxID=117157 RepID=A0A1H1TV40_9ACTN|nr:ABC transporter substrate-binding protein [Actinopolymorpha singaporensis]SDS64153.1 peptide/nickel transport system substrate-binding protein [Actinopolymorpha singaporensis]
MSEEPSSGRSLFPISRRRFVSAGAGALGLFAWASLTGCEALSTKPNQKDRGGGPAARGDKEAPMLAGRVKSGDLPPVAKRLPATPMVVRPADRVGTYGGSWRMGVTGGSGSFSQLNRFQGYEGLVRWTPDWKATPIPNVAESFEIGDGGRSYTFKLRAGMRWSDGRPFTTDDVMFWYEDVVLDKELTPVPPSWMLVENQVGKVVKLDEHTVIFQFPRPHGLFLQKLAQPGADAPVRYAKHYLSRFHKKYNDNVDDLAKKHGAPDWVHLFQSMGGIDDDSVRYAVADQPLLHPWTFTQVPGGASGRAVAERNPYYWKVDPEGRQLPYLDRLEYRFLEGDSTDTLTLIAVNGEIDMEDQFFAVPENKPVLARGREKGGYDFYKTTPVEPNVATIQLNLTHKDPAKRKVFGNKDFRIGLSHALNRQEIINIVLLRQGKPFQVAPLPGSEYYNEQLATQYLEHDLGKANHHLDRAGLTERDGSGFRLGPDGKRVTIGIDLDNGRPIFVDMAQLLQAHWKAVGVDVHVTAMDRSLWEERVRTNADFDATIHRFGGGVSEAVVLDPRYYFPFDGNSVYASAWQAWYRRLPGVEPSGPLETPPEPARRQMKLYDELTLTVAPDRRKSLMEEILQIAADEFYVLGVSVPVDGYGIVRNDFHNVPESMPNSYIYPNPAPSNPEQFYTTRSR